LAQWPELAAEARGAGIVKQEKPILVILGNPPYNAFAGISPAEEQGLVEPYKGVYEVDQIRGGKKAPKEGPAVKKIQRYHLNDPVSKGGWNIKKFNLDDLYVRFFRIAERKIAERTGQGIVCFISNFSYLSDPSFVIMRQRFLEEFDALWFDCLNGDSRETGKLTPEGKPDPSVFSTEGNREGIRVGTTIGLFCRKPVREETPSVFYRDFWGVNKRAELVESLESSTSKKPYNAAKPSRANRFSFRPSRVARGYTNWPKTIDFAGQSPVSGLQEMRRGTLMALDRETLQHRMSDYFDESIEWHQLKLIAAGPTVDGGRFVAKEARAKLLKMEGYSAARIVRYALYPFDLRWAYFSTTRPLWNEPRPALAAQHWEGNRFFVTRMFAERPSEQIPVFVTSALPDYHLLRPNAVAIPFRIRAASPYKTTEKDDGNAKFGSILEEAAPAYMTGRAKTTANLSPAARAYLAELGIKSPDSDANTAALLWLHALAIGYAPVYLTENADGIRQDWPRIPLPASKAALLASAELGRQLAALLDTETPVFGVTTAKLRPELKTVAELHSTSSPDFSITVGWGHAGQGGVTMPGKGKMLTRAYRPEEQPERPHLDLLGKSTHDIYLNDAAYWRNVPERVWDFTIGGYQVMKKWLSYRERELLGRSLTADEAREVTHTARRLAALILLQPELDANYQRIKAACHPWTA
jgi:hypothetical protein